MNQIRLLVMVLAAVMAWGCDSTKLAFSWKSPTPIEKFRKVLVLGLGENPSLRRDYEDQMAERISARGIEAIPGYALMPRKDEITLELLKALVREQKIDGVIVTRLIKVDKNVTYTPGMRYVTPAGYYRSFYGYYGVVYREVYAPGYLQEEKIVQLETNLYTTKPPDGELVWTGVTKSFNPGSAPKAIRSLVTLIAGELTKEGIL